MSLESTQRLYASLRSEMERCYSEMYMRLVMILSHLGINPRKIHEKSECILQIISSIESELVAVKAIVEAIGDFNVSQCQLKERACDLHELVLGHITGETLLDFGCGDGQVSCGMRCGSRSSNLLQYDLIDYRTDRCQYFEHGFTTDWNEVEQHAPFDCALAIVVLHHAEDPELELDRLAAVSKRLIVVESVVSRLNPVPVQGLIDWFYNRCLYPDAEIPVPGNFSHDETWLVRFADRGFKLVEHQDLGIDTFICPEHHFLYVMDKED